jgi:hypothetical protein
VSFYSCSGYQKFEIELNSLNCIYIEKVHIKQCSASIIYLENYLLRLCSIKISQFKFLNAIKQIIIKCLLTIIHELLSKRMLFKGCK